MIFSLEKKKKKNEKTNTTATKLNSIKRELGFKKSFMTTDVEKHSWIHMVTPGGTVKVEIVLRILGINSLNQKRSAF